MGLLSLGKGQGLPRKNKYITVKCLHAQMCVETFHYLNWDSLLPCLYPEQSKGTSGSLGTPMLMRFRQVIENSTKADLVIELAAGRNFYNFPANMVERQKLNIWV